MTNQINKISAFGSFLLPSISYAALAKINKTVLALCSLTGLMTMDGHTATFNWEGSSSGDWSAAANWDIKPIFDNTTVLRIASTTNLNQFIRNHRSIKVISFINKNDGNVAIGLRAANGADRDLSFSSDRGDAKIAINRLSEGTKTIGANLKGSLTQGEIVLASNLTIDHDGADALFIDCEVRGENNITLTGRGSGNTHFRGVNNFTIQSAANNNNEVRGSGNVSFDGEFRFDLRNASTIQNRSWRIVDVNSLKENFTSSFKVSSTNTKRGDFVEISDGVWAIAENGVGYEFSEHTGVLTVKPVGHWMKGSYGVGWIFRNNFPNETENWNIDTLVANVQQIPGVRHVNFNLNQAANGSTFYGPHSVLSDLDPHFIPHDRDLFDEALTKFQAAGYKVIVYWAGQGPSRLKHGHGNASYGNAWENYVASVYGSSSRENIMRANAEIVFKEYAERFGQRIDGWWFDQPEDMDLELHVEIAKAANPNCVVKTSSSGNPSDIGDVTKGHPAPLIRNASNDVVNLSQIHHAEYAAAGDGYQYSANGQPNVRHYYPGMGDKWYSGRSVWTADQAADWIERILNAGGAWTWSLNADDRLHVIHRTQLPPLLEVSGAITANESNRSPEFTAETYEAGLVEAGQLIEIDISSLASDPDGDILSFAQHWNQLQPWLSVSPEGILSGTPPEGVHVIRIFVADGKGHSDFAEFELVSY